MNHQGRRQQGDLQQFHHYNGPPQTHSPVHHIPYVAYQHHHYGPPQAHASPYPPQPMPQQWYQPNPYHTHTHTHTSHHHHQQQQQYSLPPRPFQPHGSPVVVSSHPHMVPMVPIPPVNRSMGQTPPIAHSRTPPVMRNHTPQPVSSTPSVTSQTYISSPTPPTDVTPTPPPATPSRPSYNAPPASASASASASAPVPPPAPPAIETARMPYYPELPWLSVANEPFPARASKKKRRRRAPVASTDEGLAFPSREESSVDEKAAVQQTEAAREAEATPAEATADSSASTLAAPSEVDTPSTSHSPSEAEADADANSTHPTTPSSAMHPSAVQSIQQSQQTQSTRAAGTSHARTATIPVIPLVPIKSAKAGSVVSATHKSAAADREEPKKTEDAPATVSEDGGSTEETPKASPAPKPTSWAALLRTKAASVPAQAPAVSNGVVPTNGVTVPKSNSLADALASFSVDSDKKISFLEPRGLVNSGNLCYMNSILQVLLFCVPFYDFLDQVAKRAAHSFKSETPLVDAIIMFMRDFKVIDSADSVDQLRLRLKDKELEQYGDPFAPEYVYDIIKRLPRFDNMKRGSQEDAEEFLGFLLAGLHDECAHVIKSGRQSSTPTDAVAPPKIERSGSVDGGWHEVGHKQKAAVTQSSGAIEIETPLTKIFGGKLRSEYKQPGEKTSVTFEPYQPLQLDISSPSINNISDALRAMTHLETLDGARGARASTKQVFIETLPPVLILHLKRFHYDASGPQKIWKKVGYPLELEIPKEAFRSRNFPRGLPRYRLTAVVYHHGKNASGGHYTVDLRRQEGKEWIRMDDTVIQRVRAEDVAEGGAEEDPKVLAAALEQHKNDAGKPRNMFDMGDAEELVKDEGGWSQVNGSEKSNTAKKWSNIANGTATPSSAGKRTPLQKENVRDNKVAYILFYQRIEA